MDEYTKNAIFYAIRTEKESHDFYLVAADRAGDPETRSLFLKLAAEEFEHMTCFIRLYPGEKSDFAPFLTEGASGDDSGYRELLAHPDDLVTREKALSIAIKEERSCIERYSTYLATIRIPEVHAMFQKAYDETVKHLETIEAEYAHCMGMVNDDEMDTYVRE